MNRRAFLGGLTAIAGTSTPVDRSTADTNNEISVDSTGPFGDSYRLAVTQTAGGYEAVDSHSRTLLVGVSALNTQVYNY